jgi:predicted signal transduction protein with EAL and GGDEF domain
LAPPCEFSNGQAQIGASIGIARHPPLPNDANTLIKRADAAMFEAKRAGKGCVREAAVQAPGGEWRV